MAEAFSNFFTELGEDLKSFIAWLFDYVFYTLFDSAVYHGKKAFAYIARLADYEDLSRIFFTNLFFFVIGFPIVLLLFKMIIKIVRG